VVIIKLLRKKSECGDWRFGTDRERERDTVVLGEETVIVLLWPPQIPHTLIMLLTAGVANPPYGYSPYITTNCGNHA